MDGSKLLTIHPDELINKYGMTRFIAKQVVEWVEEEGEMFDDCVRANLEGQDEQQGEQEEGQEGNAKAEQSEKVVPIANLQENAIEAKSKQEEVNDITERVEIGKWQRKA